MDVSAYLHNLNVTLSITGAAVFCDLARPIRSAISPAPDCRSAAMSSGEQIAQHGSAPEAGSEAGNPVEAGAPREQRSTPPFLVPKATIAQMMAADEIAKGGKCGCRDAGERRFLGGTSGGLGSVEAARVSSMLCRCSARRANSSWASGRQGRDDSAQASPFLVVGDREAARRHRARAQDQVHGRMGDHYPRVWKPVIATVNGWAAGAGLHPAGVDRFSHRQRRARAVQVRLDHHGCWATGRASAC
jgi:hypothetical protein